MAEASKVKEVIVDSRINKILSMRTDSVAMLEALDAISEFYIENTPENRRALLQDLEHQNISLAKKFLVEFDEIRRRFEKVESLSDKLESVCRDVAQKVSSADANMKQFMEKASELESKRNSFISQSNEIKSFLVRFQLSEEEINILHNTPLDDPKRARAFFDALQRLRSAYLDCKTMVEKHSYSAGFELLDVLGNHQDWAYQRLFGWVKERCDESAEVAVLAENNDVFLQTAIRYLRKLPIYFSQCQDLVINSRRSQLVQRFVTALTIGGTDGQSSHKAIDLHAHDAVRYVGDMLAWMHQAVASEEEFLESIFGSSSDTQRHREKRPSRGGVMPNKEEEEQDTAALGDIKSIKDEENVDLPVPELVARCLQGLGRPLRSRIMQTIESRANLGALYTIADLLYFYERTFAQILPVENAVHSAIKGCLGEARRLFQALLQKQAETLTTCPSSYPLDLTVSSTTRDCCRQIIDVLDVHAAALSPLSSDPADECNCELVLGNIIQSLLHSCRLTGQPLSQGDMAIFMLNNVSDIQNELREASKKHGSSQLSLTTGRWLDVLKKEALTWVDVLVAEEVTRMLRRSDLDKLLDLLEVLPPEFVASEQPGLSADRVATALRAFYSSLFSTIASQYDRLVDPDWREITRARTADAIAESYRKVHEVVSNPANKYDLSILSHSVEEVKVLLGCVSAT